MKKLAFVLLIIQPIISNAQLEKFPTSSDSPIWGYYSVGGYLPSPEFALYGLVGDTIINSKNYSKLYSLTDTILSESATKDFLGGIRELDNKVYYFNVFSSKEELLYDFSVNLNDTIELNEFGDYAVVKDIDTVVINENIHKRFHLENPNGTGKWIENIGSIHGLLTNILYPTDNNPPTTTLVCFKYQHINYYPNYNCGCFEDYFVTTALDEKKVLENRFVVYPNPITNESIISISTDEPLQEISLYNIKGSLVWSASTVSETYHIESSEIESGVYFISAKMQNGNYYSTKIIKP